MKRIFFSLFLITPSLWAGSYLQQAEELLKSNKLEAAVKLLTPCIKESDANDNDLTECLYLGERAAKEFETDMLKRQLTDDQKESSFKEVGLEFESSHYSGPIYKNAFFKRLNSVFPQSKYRDEVQYILREWVMNDWRANEKQLLEYLKEFPTGRYSVNAKLDLAHIYDNVWDVVRPNSPHRTFHETLSSGDDSKDLALAEESRKKATKYYQDVLETKSVMTISEWDLKDAKERIEGLKEGKQWNHMYIL